MLLFLTCGLALWTLAVLFILALCRAAARADENDAGRRLVRAGRRGATVSLAAAAVTLPAVPAEAAARAACANRDLRFGAAPAEMREALRCEIARVRDRDDARRLRWDPRLELAATRHAVDMFERRYFSHTSPGGGGLADRAQRVDYAQRGCSWSVGEVLAWGVGPRSTAVGTIRAWMRSSGHRRVIVSHRYREIGLGLTAGTPAGSTSGVTVAVMLGRRHCSD